MENQPIRIMVLFDSIEDNEILEQMPKWAKGSWIREQVRKTVLIEKDVRNQEILEFSKRPFAATRVRHTKSGEKLDRGGIAATSKYT